MKSHMYRTISTFLCMVLLAAILVACAAFRRAIPEVTPAGDQLAVSSPEAAHKSYMAPLLNPANPVLADWSTFASPELGIQFRFPPLPGETSYEYHNWPEREGDPTGTLVEWQVTREDRHETYTFAALESEDMQVGRDRWFTDIIRWFFDATLQNYYVVYAGPNHPRFEVQPLRVVTRSDGLQGIIFTPDYMRGSGMSAVLSLPDGYLPKIQVISFYFPDPVTQDEIETVLNSVLINP
jgi:hypothetical protein